MMKDGKSLPNGKGVMKWPDGYTYNGGFVEGKISQNKYPGLIIDENKFTHRGIPSTRDMPSVMPPV